MKIGSGTHHVAVVGEHGRSRTAPPRETRNQSCRVLSPSPCLRRRSPPVPCAQNQRSVRSLPGCRPARTAPIKVLRLKYLQHGFGQSSRDTGPSAFPSSSACCRSLELASMPRTAGGRPEPPTGPPFGFLRIAGSPNARCPQPGIQASLGGSLDSASVPGGSRGSYSSPRRRASLRASSRPDTPSFR